MQVLDELKPPREVRTSYTVEEVAKLLDKTLYTIMHLCLNGCINATKRAEKRGGVELWSIGAAELARYRDEGLLPIDPHRNAG
ncbi:MAG TPA: hypothetical protein VG406_07630 [Isosphaeraceae bacterium]|nr:hypothetical protein [Isosphaeraceae bacterium]